MNILIPFQIMHYAFANNDLAFETIPLSIFENTNICGTIYHRILTLIKSFSVYVTLKRQHLSTNLKKHKLALFHTTQLMPLSPHARKSEIEFWIRRCGFRIPSTRFKILCQGNRDSGLQTKNLLHSGIHGQKSR